MPNRLALIGDVHANLPALAAVLDAISSAGITRGICTGDLVMRGTDPAACVNRLRDLGWPTVLGNTDRKVGHRPRRAPDHPKAARVGSRAWSTNQLSVRALTWLAGLPLVTRADLGDVEVVVMHGGPDDPRDAIDETTPERDLRKLVKRMAGPAAIVSGHTHRQLVREVDGCLFVNPGSVGEAIDGDRRPAWAWLEARKTGLKVHFERVEEPLATIRGH